MKFGTKMLSAVTAGLVLAASLAGCSSGAATATPTPIPLPEGVPEDVILEAAGIAKDTPSSLWTAQVCRRKSSSIGSPILQISMLNGG